HAELAAKVDVAGVRIYCAATDQDAFDDSVRIVFELVAIGKGPGLAFIGIAADVDRLLVVGRDEAPLRAGRKGRPAASAQVRIVDLVENLWRLQLNQRLAQGVETAIGPVHVKTIEVRDIQPASENAFHRCLVMSAARLARRSLVLLFKRHQLLLLSL